MKRTVAGGTSPTAVTLWPSMTVEKAEEEPTVADSSTWASSSEASFDLGFWALTSTNTDTEARPSVNTRWSTGSVEPGRVWALRTVILKPGGNFRASHTTVSTGAASFGGLASLRSHWKPSVDTSGLNAASGMRDASVRLANTTCSIT